MWNRPIGCEVGSIGLMISDSKYAIQCDRIVHEQITPNTFRLVCILCKYKFFKLNSNLAVPNFKGRVRHAPFAVL